MRSKSKDYEGSLSKHLAPYARYLLKYRVVGWLKDSYRSKFSEVIIKINIVVRLAIAEVND